MDKPIYNSMIIKTYLEYLKNNYPGINFGQLLQYAGISEYEVEDRGHWLTQTQINRFHEFVGQATANPNISRQVGRYISSPASSASAVLRKSLAGFLSPAVAYWAVGKISTIVTRHMVIQSNQLAHNKTELMVTIRPGIKEEPFQCQTRMGMLEAVAEIFTGKHADIVHPECLHQDGRCCRYIISWESPQSLTWNRIGSYTLAASVLASFPLFFILPVNPWLIAALSSMLLSTGILLFGSVLRNREMAANLSEQGKASEDVLTLINLRYNESLLAREIGEAATTLPDPRELLMFITDALHQRLMFERSIVMLTDPEKTRLQYSAGRGFTPHEEALLNTLSFSLTNSESKGFFYQAYISQKPVVVEASQMNTPPLPDETGCDMIRQLGMTSVICVPIVYKSITTGILIVDIGKFLTKPTQSEVSLLVGIAQQIALSLNNALTHNKMRESEERFGNLGEISPDIIYQLDPEGKIKYVNAAWEDILGHRPTEITGKFLGDFLNHEDRLVFDVMLQNFRKDKSRVRDRHFTIFSASGLPRRITLSGAPDVDVESRKIGMVGTIKDITKLRSMEAQLLQASKMEAVGALTGGIVHDFNNIIQAIMGYNQLMLSGKFGNEADLPYLNSIGELITRPRELVRQLLLFSKKVEPLSGRIDLNTEIRSVHNLLSKSISKTIDIKTDLAPDVLPITADSSQIGQIIMNLVINARDAIEDSGSIIIKTANLDLPEESAIHGRQIPPGTYVQMSVADTGCGMREDLIKRIFEPFFTTKEPGKGTGLGLAVVYGIIKNHDGFIFCESEPGKGTTFYIIFPASSSGTLPGIPAAENPFRENTGGTENILLVDDEKTILETVKDSLSLHGYQVTTAESGEQAAEIYKRRPSEIDLIILDLIMPGCGGKACLQNLLKINRHAKILMTGGYSTDRQTDDLALSGASGFIHKPYRPEELLSVIRKVLDSPDRPDTSDNTAGAIR